MATGATVRSSYTAYASGADMVAARDWRAVADLLAEPSTSTGAGTRPSTSAEVVTYFTTTDAVGYRALRWASGTIEAAVMTGSRYKPEDLQELAEAQTIPTAQGGDGSTTAYMIGRDLLVGLVCDLAFWWLSKRRKPGIKPEEVAGATEALELLERLRLGEAVFPFADSQDAGLAEMVELDEYTDRELAAEPISLVAARMFGTRR